MPATDIPLASAREAVEATHFELWPHRATGPAGFCIIAGSVGAAMLVVAAVPGWYGLWPVSAMVVASYVFFIMAFAHNRRAACYGEIIDVTPRAIMIQSQCRRGGAVMRSTFDPHWVRIGIASDYYVENRLTLRQSGRVIEIGRFLAPEERVELARELADALQRVRQPPASGF